MYPINRDAFFAYVRQNLYPGVMRPSQFEGISQILAHWNADKTLTDVRWLAYILASSYHETGRKMQPVEEIGKGKGHPYGKPDHITGQIYYGRGYIQITHRYHYETFGKLLGIDLVHYPELACDPHFAMQIMFRGMIEGLFTGRGLPRYFDGKTERWVDARKIVNGLDRAEDIAEYAKKFLTALKANQLT